jgi:hypothetical protein
MTNWMVFNDRRKLLHAISLAFAISPCILFWASARTALESSMALHMGVEFPWLFSAGVALAFYSSRFGFKSKSLDPVGLLGCLIALLTTAFWMLPVALDLALIYPGWAAFKYGSWYFAGLLFLPAWQRAHPALKIFFVGNQVWMLFTVGLIFQDLDSQLCVSYGVPSQQVAGQMLVFLGSVLACVYLVGNIGSFLMRERDLKSISIL